MRRFDRSLISVGSDHKQENYVGPLASSDAGGFKGNVNNLYKSQLRSVSMVMPYGISSRALSGMKTQTVVNSNNDNVGVGIFDPARPSVGVGEICIYSSGKANMYLSSNGDASLETGSASIDLKNSGAINMYNDDGSVNIDKSGNVGISNGDGYTVAVGIYSDESGDSDEDTESTDGITLKAEDAKITLDGSTGEIDVKRDETTGINISEDNDIEITADEIAYTKLKHDGEIDIYNDVVDVKFSKDGDISMKNDVAEISADKVGKVIVKNANATVTIDVSGKIQINSMQDIALSSATKVKIDAGSTIDFHCTQFNVNDQTMIIP